MKKAAYLFYILIYFFTFSSHLAAQPAQTSAMDVVEKVLPGDLPLPQPFPYPSLQELERAIQQSDTRTVTEVMARLDVFREQMEQVRLPELAYAVWNAGYEAYRRGDRVNAELCWDMAFKLDATNPRFYISLARIRFSQGMGHWWEALQYLYNGWRAIQKRPLGAPLAAYGMFDFLVLWFLLILTGLGVLALVRGFLLLVHDLWEKMGASAHLYPVARAVAILMLGLPLFFAGIILGAVWLGLVLMFYLQKPLRRVLIGLIALTLVALGMEYYFYSQYQIAERQPDPWIRQFIEEPQSPKLMHELYLRLQENPKNELAYLAYASYFIRTGAYSNALAVYKKALRNGVRSAAIWNNIGTIFYHMELLPQALQVYQYAQQSNPADPELKALILYNQGKTYQALLDFSRGESLIGQAMEMDPGLTQRITPEVSVLVYLPTMKHFRAMPQPSPVTSTLRLLISDRRALVLLIFILLAGGLHGFNIIGTAAERCERCGEAYCRRCHAGGYRWPYCAACVHLFVLRDGISPVARDRKLRQVRAYEQRQRLKKVLLGLLLPGSARLSVGDSLSGLGVLMLWSLAVALVAGIRWAGPWWMKIPDFPIVAFVGLVFLFLIYMVNTIVVLIRGA